MKKMIKGIAAVLLMASLAVGGFAACGDKGNESGENSSSSVQEEEITITLNTTEVSLEVGETFVLTASVLPVSAMSKMREWSSNNGTVVTVDGTGFLEAKAAGEAVITVTVGDASAQCVVTVTDGEA